MNVTALSYWWTALISETQFIRSSEHQKINSRVRRLNTIPLMLQLLNIRPRGQTNPTLMIPQYIPRALPFNATDESNQCMQTQPCEPNTNSSRALISTKLSGMQTEQRQASFSPRAWHPLTIKTNQSVRWSTAGQTPDTPPDFTRVVHRCWWRFSNRCVCLWCSQI